MTKKDDILAHTQITAVASRYAEVKRIGQEWVTLCPWHDDTKPSLTIYDSPKGHQLCHCFSCGAHGNVIDYFMQQTGMDFKEAIDSLSEGILPGASAKPLIATDKPIKPAEWMAAKPPVGNTPKFSHYDLGEPVGIWPYKDAKGEVLYYECRYETTDADGEITKHPRPLTWGRLSVNLPYKWSPRHWPSPRPLYGLDQVAKYPDSASIVVFEGPRKAEYASSLVKVPCIAWAAGASGWRYSDWSISKGRKFILVPDNDDAGRKAMLNLAQHLYGLGAESVQIVTISDKPDKWDICDDKDLTPDALKALLKQRTEAKDMMAAAVIANQAIRKASRYVLDTAKIPHDDGYLGVTEKEEEGYQTGETPIELYQDLAGQTDDLDFEPVTECYDGEYGACDDSIVPLSAHAEECPMPECNSSVNSGQILGNSGQIPDKSSVNSGHEYEPPTIKAMMYQRTAGEEEWPEPEDLISTETGARDIPLSALPNIIADAATAKAPHIGANASALAMAMLGATACAIDDRIKIAPDRYGHWTESARLWVALIGPPSAKKTPTINAAVGALQKLDDELTQTVINEKKKFAVLQKAYNKAMDEWAADQTKPMPPAPTPPEIPRYVMNNITIEAFGELMQSNPRGAAMLVDELSGWIVGMGQYKASGGSDRSEWLQAYNGGSMKIDRVSRGTISIPNFSACVLGGIQSDVMRKVARDTPEDGLMQRFMIAFIPPGDPGTSPTPEQAKHLYMVDSRYKDMLRHFATMTPDNSKVFMTDEARAATDKLFRKIHAYARANLFGPKASSALDKFEGTIHRMALIYHCIECYGLSKHPADMEVSLSTVQMVETLFMKYIIPNTAFFYKDVIGESNYKTDLQTIALWLVSHDHERVTANSLRQMCSNMRHKTINERKELLSQLSDAGWLRADGIRRDAASNMPQSFAVNPRIYDKYAISAKVEREQVAIRRAMMLEIGMIKADR